MTFRSIRFQVVDWSLEDWNVDITEGIPDLLDLNTSLVCFDEI